MNSLKKAVTGSRPDSVTGKVRPRPTNAVVEHDPSKLLTLTEAAQMLGHVHRTTIMRWVKEDKLRCVRLSRKVILFEPDEIQRFVRSHRDSGK